MTLNHLTRSQDALRRAGLDPVGQLQDELERFFAAPFTAFGSPFFNVWAPPLDVYEDKENLFVTLEVPGLRKEDFDIALHDGVLSVSGERKLEERRQKTAGYRTERFNGRFQRSVTLPKAVQADKVRAAYRDGVLTVTLPISEAARPKQIVVGNE